MLKSELTIKRWVLSNILSPYLAMLVTGLIGSLLSKVVIKWGDWDIDRVGVVLGLSCGCYVLIAGVYGMCVVDISWLTLKAAIVIICISVVCGVLLNCLAFIR